MNICLQPGSRSGCVRIPASKSQAHRLLICAALGQGETQILCDGLSKDIEATIRCLNALAAQIQSREDGVLAVRPIRTAPKETCHLFCGESGSTLRFLLPLVGALNVNAVFHMEGRLPQRPLAPLDTQLRDHGMEIRQEEECLFCSGRLEAGEYSLPGNVSSQYISGLLMALPLLERDSSLQVTGKVESAAYITMTEDALAMSGVRLQKTPGGYRIDGKQKPALPARLEVEADYSSAAFFLSIGALSPMGMCVRGLSPDSAQGDRAILGILEAFGAELSVQNGETLIRRKELNGVAIDASPIPDLIPALSVVASVSKGETRIFNAGRLRLKESDRLQSTTGMLRALGAEITELEDGLIIQGRERLRGGIVDAAGDHRIAMAAAVAACVCREPVTILGAECVQKSYPRFWEDFGNLFGGES